MTWFKNAIIYQLNEDYQLTKDNIEKAIKTKLFVPCGSSDQTKMGWISPFHDDDQDNLVVDMNGQLLLKMKTETKLLPSSVIKQALNEKIAKQETALARQLSKNEKLTLKDEVLIDLLPRAFSKYRYIWLWIDIPNKRVVVDCSSFKQAEELISTLRKELGSFPTVPLSSENPVEQIMTTWVKEKQSYSPFELGDEAELKDPLEGNGIIRCKNQDIMSDEMLAHIDAGKQITKLALVDNNGVRFILNNDVTLKRIKFDAGILDENEDISKDETEKKIEADFFIMTKTLSQTINSICKILLKNT